MFGDETYTTPEGFTLYRRLLLPEVRSFAEVLTFERDWDYATMNHNRGIVPRPDLVPEPGRIGRNEIGPFCTVQRVDNGRPQRKPIAVTPTQATLDAIAPRIATGDDHLSFKVLYHEANDRYLIVAEHNYIIGSHWLAYVKPSTLPAELGAEFTADAS